MNKKNLGRFNPPSPIKTKVKRALINSIRIWIQSFKALIRIRFVFQGRIRIVRTTGALVYISSLESILLRQQTRTQYSTWNCSRWLDPMESRWYWLDGSNASYSGGYNSILFIYHPIFPPTCLLVNLSILFYLPIRHWLANLAWQVLQHSTDSLFSLGGIVKFSKFQHLYLICSVKTIILKNVNFWEVYARGAAGIVSVFSYLGRHGETFIRAEWPPPPTF